MSALLSDACSISQLYCHSFANRPPVTGQPRYYCVDRDNDHPEKYTEVRVLSPAKDYGEMLQETPTKCEGHISSGTYEF